MAKKSQGSTEEKEVAVDTGIVADGASDTDEMMAALEAEIAEAQTKVKTAKAKVRELKGEPVRKTAVAAPTKTLDQVIAEQDETPKLYAIQRLVIAANQRIRAGQDQATAVKEVVELYTAVTLGVLNSEGFASKTANAAIIEYLRANYPKALDFHDRGFKSATEGLAKKAAKSGNDQPTDFGGADDSDSTEE